MQNVFGKIIIKCLHESPNNIINAIYSPDFARMVVCVNGIITVLADWFWAILDTKRKSAFISITL